MNERRYYWCEACARAVGGPDTPVRNGYHMKTGLRQTTQCPCPVMVRVAKG